MTYGKGNCRIESFKRVPWLALRQSPTGSGQKLSGSFPYLRRILLTVTNGARGETRTLTPQDTGT